MTKNNAILVSSTIAAILLIVAGIHLWIFFQSNAQSGNIVLREKKSGSTTQSSILVIDADGNRIRTVGYFEGSPTWSPDGRFIAVGCEKDICILDFSTMPDMRNNLGMRSSRPEFAYRIPAPKGCEEKVNYGGGGGYFGILSISWSPSGKKMAVVCGSEDPKEIRSVCILSLEGMMDCWNESISKDIFRVAWSPVDEDLIATGGPDTVENTSEIRLVDSKGQNPVVLTQGLSPEWSPDGRQIAYIKMESDHLGIAIINVDGTGFHWIGRSTQGWGYDCRGFTGTCRLSWSPNGRYIIFTSPPSMGIGLELYRMDLQTGDAIRLLDNMIFQYPAEPDWGP